MTSSNLRDYYLHQIGIESWLLRNPVQDSVIPTFRDLFAESVDPVGNSTQQDIGMLMNCQQSLEDLANTVAACQRCPLHRTRTHTVFSRGNPNAKLMIIGEAPGFYEDKQAKPFVGKAGALLNNMLRAVTLDHNDVYIANVLKCRPPNNRDPELEEINQCSEYLTAQIALVKPQLIMALGRFAGQFLLKQTLTLARMRQSVHHYQSIPVVVTYHPAYLLRNPKDKVNSYQDLIKVKTLIT